VKKTVNYTDAQVSIILALAAQNGGVLNYDDAITLSNDERMNDADGNKREPRSIVAKISRLVNAGEVAYKRKEPTTKDGSPIVKKSELVARIAAAAGLNASALESMDKSAKSALVLVADAIETLREKADAFDDESDREAA